MTPNTVPEESACPTACYILCKHPTSDDLPAISSNQLIAQVNKHSVRTYAYTYAYTL